MSLMWIHTPLSDKSPARSALAVLLLLIYGFIVVLPVLAAFLISPIEYSPGLIYLLGQVLALTAVPVLALQPVLSARLKIADRVFGLDRIYRFHKIMAQVAGVFILIHPILLAAGSGNWPLLFSLEQKWYILTGKAALFLAVILIISSLFYKAMKLGYEKWRWSHNLLALLILPGIVIHSLWAGVHLKNPALFSIWILLLAIALLAYLYHKLIGPIVRKKRAFRVDAVHRESHSVYTVEMTARKAAGKTRSFEHLPGQFQFLTFYRGRGLPVEEHPFTISSSPRELDRHGSTIKESGDFTSTIGLTRPSDRVAVQAPFGRFSYVLHPDEKEFVFIAGGIGITPLMSMLRHMRDTGRTCRVLLLYGNKTERDMVFREELERMQARGTPGLKVVHVLEQAGTRWPGETGLITPELVRRKTSGRPQDWAYYVCGPSAMMKIIIPALRELGVSSRRIHSELFSL